MSGLTETDNRDEDFNRVWKAIRSVRTRFDDHVLKCAERFITIETWRIHLEKEQTDWRRYIENEQKKVNQTLDKIEITLEKIREYQNQQKGIEKANARTIAIYSAIGGGSGAVAMSTFAKMMGFI